jgi:hypothetical protein
MMGLHVDAGIDGHEFILLCLLHGFEHPFGPRPVFGGVGFLHKVQVQSGGLVEGFLVEAFIKETTGVAAHLGFEDEDFRNGGGVTFMLAALLEATP